MVALISLSNVLVLLVVPSKFVMHQMFAKKGSLGSLFLFLLFANAAVFAGVDTQKQCDLSPSVLASSAHGSGEIERVVVQAVIDGDTLLLKGGRRIRVIGINTPELAHHEQRLQPLATQAHQRMLALLSGAGKAPRALPFAAILKVGQDGKDHYGRTLGHIFTSKGENVTTRLLAEGWGFHVAIPPNVWGADCYSYAEKIAKAQGVGVWGDSYYRLKSSEESILSGGYKRIVGTIEKLFISKKVIWVALKGGVVLKLDRRDSAFHKGAVLESILRSHGAGTLHNLPKIELQGWLIDRSTWGAVMAKKIKQGKRKRWQLNVRHHTQWQLRAAL